MSGNKKSVSSVTYFPPSLKPIFMGAQPPTKSGVGSLFNSGNEKFFQDYRNEAISKFQMPEGDYGIMKTPYSPKPDIVAANKIAKIDKLNDAPQVNMTFVNRGDRKRIDDFYKACQKHREVYMDHTGHRHPLRYFATCELPFQSSTDPTSSYLKHPQYYASYKQPLTVPLTVERTYPIPTMPNRSLAGRYADVNSPRYIIG